MLWLGEKLSKALLHLRPLGLPPLLSPHGTPKHWSSEELEKHQVIYLWVLLALTKASSTGEEVWGIMLDACWTPDSPWKGFKRNP